MSVINITRKITKAANRRIGNPLEWQSSSKAMLLGAVTAILYLHYALWAEFLLLSGNEADHIDLDYLAGQLDFLWLCVCVFGPGGGHLSGATQYS